MGKLNKQRRKMNKNTIIFIWLFCVFGIASDGYNTIDAMGNDKIIARYGQNQKAKAYKLYNALRIFFHKYEDPDALKFTDKLFGLRHDRVKYKPKDSLCSRLTEKDLRNAAYIAITIYANYNANKKAAYIFENFIDEFDCSNRYSIAASMCFLSVRLYFFMENLATYDDDDSDDDWKY
jgi:hypothetical protein